MPDVSVLIEGGKATPAPPLGPALAPLGVNVGQIVAEINAKTKDFAGMKVPVTISVDAKTKNHSISVGSPPASALILREAKAEKAPPTPRPNSRENSPTSSSMKSPSKKSTT